MDIIADMDFAEMDAEKQYRLMYAECLGDRPGAKALLLWMESAGFFTAPASARHHLNTPGGLCRHTINVAMNASDLCNAPAFMDVNAKEAMVAALLHDLCKIGKYRAGDNGKYTYDDTRLLGHGEESVIIAQQFIRLSYDETLAIRWHMGAYSGERDWNTLGKAYDACPLAMLLHFADMMATHCDEVERANGK